ncbi:4Fe-4S binding protein [Thermovenabulum sp.]|uniref:4Fe-4S binding protein n=1 Tax=Thermovenabulum sp. TaxID=3100335 RepID=UPI003C7E567E
MNKARVKNEKINYFRLFTQISFFIIVLITVIIHSLDEKGITINLPFFAYASLHSICPFGGIVSVYKFVTEGAFVQKIHESSFVILMIVIILSILFGSVFCGFICPFGSVQEWIGKVGKRVLGKKFNRIIPSNYDKFLRYFRFAVLLWILYVTAKTGTLVFADFDPYNALFTFWTGEVAIQSLIFLGVVVILSFFIERPFCKYFCPLGAFIGLFNFIRIFKVKRVPASCISCKKCSNVCPMNIDVHKKEIINDPQCITCLQCSSEISCPVENTVIFETKRR